MSKLLRLPLVLLIALAVTLVWAVPASAELPTPEACATTPTLEGCPPPSGPVLPDDSSTGDLTAAGDGGGDGESGDGDAGAGGTGAGDAGAGGTGAGSAGAGGGEAGGTGGTRVIDGEAVPAFPGFGTRSTGSTGESSALLEPLTPPAEICAEIPAFPGCPGAPSTPSQPLTCEQLADLLGLPECPESFTCEDLAEILGLEGCPEGGPTCEDLAALFGLEECPEPPGSCEDFAELLGVENCEQIPCLDTSSLPDDAKEGLAPLLEGLEQIGVKACPPKPATGGGTNTGGSPQPVRQQPPAVHYENCDDARAKGKAPVYSTDPGYRPGLDSDNDGIGCEETTQLASTTVTPTGRTLAYTGVDLEPMLRIAAILISSGTLLVLSGVRRRA